MRLHEFALPNIFGGSKFTIDEPKGRTGPEVADVQKALQALGYDVGPTGVDGVRGPYTSDAVKKFQQDNDLGVDGDPGPETVAALNSVLTSKPEIASKLTKSTEADVKGGGGSGANIDVSTIQDPDFNVKLGKIADALGVEKNALLAIMKQESGVNPKAVNKMSGATGLIQFMPSTARSLGTTTDELYNMSAVEQLDYVYKYFKMVGVKPGMDVGDLYMAVFMPAHMGKPDSTVLGQAGDGGFSGKVYAQNKGLDRDRNGAITVADVKSAVQRFA
jgi:peptidoglycan hydrolase-like protein with peptidoglycan-binding domain